MSSPPHPTRSNSSSMQQISQHKRSLSFNHHLSYTQVQQQQQQQQAPHTPQHQQLLSQRKEIVPISPNIKSVQPKSMIIFINFRSNPIYNFHR